MRARRLVPFVVLWASCYTSNSDLPPPVVPRTPLAQDMPDSSAVITDETASLTYKVIMVGGEDQFVGILDHRIQIKILTEEGREHARFLLPIDAFTSVSRVVARSVDMWGNVTEMDPGSPKAIARSEPGQSAPELKWLSFEVPDAQVDGVIDVLYTRVYTGAYLIPPWVFGGALPKVRSEFSVIFPKELRIDHRFGRGSTLVDEPPLRRELPDGWTRLVFVEQNLPAYFDEPDGPHMTWQAPWVATVIAEGERGGKKIRMESWEDVRERVLKAFAAVGGAAGQGTTAERYAKVRDAINPVDQIGLGTCEPAKAGGVLGGKPACTRDAAGALFKALEGSEGKFYPALLAGPKGPVVSEGFPSLYGFIRAVVAVDVREQVKKDPTCKEDPINRGLLCSIPDDSYAFLDPMCTGCRFGELPSEYGGGRALVFPTEGDPQWVDVPIDPPERNRLMVQYRLRLDVDGSLKGDMNGEITGAISRHVRRALRGQKDVSDIKRDDAINLNVLGPSTDLRLRGTTVEALDQVDEPVRFTGKIETKAEVLAYEKFRLNPASAFGPALPGRWRRGRRTPAILEAPAWFETVATVQLPVGYDILQDPVSTLVTPFAEYAAGFAIKDRTLSFSRRVVIKTQAVDVEEWPEFRAFLDQIEDLEHNGVPVFLGEQVEDE